PALSPPGRGGHAVLHHDRPGIDEEQRRDDPLPRRHGADSRRGFTGGRGDHALSRDGHFRRGQPPGSGHVTDALEALDALRSRGESFLPDVAREYYSSPAGLKA